MMREISVFSGREDIARTLGLLVRTATGMERTHDNALPQDVLAETFDSPEGHSAVLALAERFGIDQASLPSHGRVCGPLS